MTDHVLTTERQQELENGVRAAVAELAGVEAREVTPEVTFEALDVDSLDLVEQAQILQEEHGLHVETKEFKDVKTVGDALDVVLRQADV